MYFILDHLSSIVPAAIILLLLGSLQIRSQDENVDAFRSETNRARMLDLAHVLERDLRNAGSGVDGAAILDWSNAQPTGSSPVTILDFVTRIDTSATATVSRLRYGLSLSDSTLVDGEVVHLYALHRVLVGEAGVTTLSTSPPLLTSFELALLDQFGVPTTSAANARAFTIHATSLSPFGADGLTRDSRWETVIWPVNLRLQ